MNKPYEFQYDENHNIEKIYEYMCGISERKICGSLIVLNYIKSMSVKFGFDAIFKLEEIDEKKPDNIIIVAPFSKATGIPMNLDNLNNPCLEISKEHIPNHLFIIDHKSNQYRDFIRKLPLMKGMLVVDGYNIEDSDYYCMEWDKRK